MKKIPVIFLIVGVLFLQSCVVMEHRQPVARSDVSTTVYYPPPAYYPSPIFCWGWFHGYNGGFHHYYYRH